MDEGPTQSCLRAADPELEPALLPAAQELSAKYELRRVIGKGGMGSVVLALHRELHEPVAIKLLHAELASSEFLPRFKREARAAIRIKSPHVARIMDVGDLASGVPYIVMEYLDGLDLGHWVATRGRLPPLFAVELLLQALDAIGEAHALGIVHRDIKPANLFVTHDRGGSEFVKVLDFGLAKSLCGMDSGTRPITEPGMLVGSPCYMPPEQLLDAQNADPRSDVWSLGTTLFELVTGQPPFQAPTMPQLYTAIVHGKIRRATDLAPDCPSSIDAVISRCLSRNAEMRYANAEELRSALVEARDAASDRVVDTDTLKCPVPMAEILSETLTVSVAPVASSFSPEKRLAAFVRPSLLSRRVLGLAAAALVGMLVAFAGAHHAGDPAPKRAGGVPSSQASAAQERGSAEPPFEAESTVEKPPAPSASLLERPAPAPRTPARPASTGHAKTLQGDKPKMPIPSASAPPESPPSRSIYDEYP